MHDDILNNSEDAVPALRVMEWLKQTQRWVIAVPCLIVYYVLGLLLNALTSDCVLARPPGSLSLVRSISEVQGLACATRRSSLSPER